MEFLGLAWSQKVPQKLEGLQRLVGLSGREKATGLTGKITNATLGMCRVGGGGVSNSGIQCQP